MSSADSRDLPGPLEPAAPENTMSELARWVVNRLSLVGLSLDSARSIVTNGPAGDRIAAAADQVDRLIREIRDHVFAEPLQASPAGLSQKSRLGDRGLAAKAVDRAALRERLARTARALQASAADSAALLEQAADLARPPQRVDYQTEIKRWQAFADQAEQMARRWEQRP